MRSPERPRPVRTFEGRPLARPDEELVDQGLAFDVATVVERRKVLRALGLGLSVAGLAACTGSSGSGGSAASTPSSTAAASGEIPDETAGPYPADGSNGPNVLDRSGIVRGDIRSSFGDADGTAEGVPLTIDLVIKNLAEGGAAFAGTAVYVWHCDRAGGYSLYSEGITDQNFLRGVQIADADGKVSFTSIFPACYSGRWPHVHFEVYPAAADITDSSRTIATSQVALPKAACDTVYREAGYEASVPNLAQVTLDDDNVFGDDGGASQLGTTTGSVAAGYRVSLEVGVDTTTTPTGGRLSGDGAPSGAPPGGGPGGRPSGPPPTGDPIPSGTAG